MTTFSFDLYGPGRTNADNGKIGCDQSCGNIRLSVVLNNEPTYDEPRPKTVELALWANGGRIDIDLEFLDVKRLHACLDMLLEIGPLERLE